ncbi:acetylornithine transaminase [Streptomyces collinus]|uniref:acetylornithine transaminase n=1 Tax=Streptomyces collinus TaxID=42684 RepID=UPI002942337D|nr:acetylornithine transaminase [Streptomyces collinus]
MGDSRALRERFRNALMGNYGVPPVAVVEGQGCVVTDLDGRTYLDLIGGLAVSTLGHAHPALVRAVSGQVARLAHISNLSLHEQEVRLAERLLGLVGGEGRVFFANSGAEANEAAFKLVRKHAGAERTYVVAARDSFHGRTMGALSLTGAARARQSFDPFCAEVRHVAYGSTEELRSAVTPQCAAVFLEPVQGEAGVIPPPPGYLRAARELCDRTGAVLVFDEVQSGIGRTGLWFAHQHDDVLPDVLTLAKGLGGGLPISACIGLGRYGSVFEQGDHGSTFGGNPVSCAAAHAVLDTIEGDELLGNATKTGALLASGLATIDHPLLAGVRGIGLWQAVRLTEPRARSVEAHARQTGFLVNAVQPNVVRLSPPLILTADEAQSFIDALPGLLSAALTTPADEVMP